MADSHIAQRETQNSTNYCCSDWRDVQYVPYSHNDRGGKRSKRIQVGTQNDRNISYKDVTQHAAADTG